ncbi:3'-5' exonuclease [Verrucomicrobiota bacterium sgz303538]
MYVDCPTRDCRTRIYIGSIQSASEVRCDGCAGIFAIASLLEIARLSTESAPTPPSDFVIYDLETTGLSSEDCEIIQIAAVRYRGGEILRNERFFQYVKPTTAIPAHITSLTGVTNRDVANAPSQKEAILAFSRFVGNGRLIAHNGSRFDSKFLEATCHRERLETRQVDSIDSIHLSQRLFGIKEGLSHGMDAVLSRLSLSTVGYSRHDARADVELLAQMVQVLHHRLQLDLHLSGIRTHVTIMPTESALL